MSAKATTNLHVEQLEGVLEFEDFSNTSKHEQLSSIGYGLEKKLSSPPFTPLRALVPDSTLRISSCDAVVLLSELGSSIHQNWMPPEYVSLHVGVTRWATSAS